MCITGPVGRHGTNRIADVTTVQILLNLNLNAARWDAVRPLAVDGRMGDETAAAIERFQARTISEARPDGRVDPGGATLKALAAGLPAELTADTLRGIMLATRPDRAQAFAGPLAVRMRAHAIDTPRRRAHFLAQIGHESGELRFTEELASGLAYEGRRDLGNTEPGDGPRFKGRGLIQLTGRANYAAFGTAIGVDLVDADRAKLVGTDRELAVAAACWFWATHGLNVLADADDVRGITRRINGGLNGLADRVRLLDRARFFCQA